MKTSEKFNEQVMPHLRTKEEVHAATEELFKTIIQVMNKHKISPATYHLDITVGAYHRENDELELMIGRARMGTHNLGMLVEQQTRANSTMEDFSRKITNKMIESMMSDDEYVDNMTEHIHDEFEEPQDEEEDLDPVAQLVARLGLGGDRPTA